MTCKDSERPGFELQIDALAEGLADLVMDRGRLRFEMLSIVGPVECACCCMKVAKDQETTAAQDAPVNMIQA